MLLAIIGSFLTLVLIIAFVAALAVLPLFWVASYAQEKGRDPFPWVLRSLFVSPFAVLLLLWLLPPVDRYGS